MDVHPPKYIIIFWLKTGFFIHPHRIYRKLSANIEIWDMMTCRWNRAKSFFDDRLAPEELGDVGISSCYVDPISSGSMIHDNNGGSIMDTWRLVTSRWAYNRSNDASWWSITVYWWFFPTVNGETWVCLKVNGQYQPVDGTNSNWQPLLSI